MSMRHTAEEIVAKRLVEIMRLSFSVSSRGLVSAIQPDAPVDHPMIGRS
jgi:hypothetical protein